ncbi:potassium channel family protein [Gottfriedia acidiceleris]|uniref:TrkA family potassium uptake protein n=1 Tax=Gottfriedia acidiceleris TaxID=371036 RepID=A0ABY4JHV6_9BACI|nr:TrkA family potassium uptake protein [Gottfriedia acidiceleris]UPM53411.1 TrkA family potassium uptake protein [Gottfriedia acidiceleris]
MPKQYLVIGAGRFGRGIVKEFDRLGHEVVVCDKDKKTLEQLEEYTEYAVIGDLREESILEDLSVSQFDAVFVAIGTDSLASILITRRLKERKVKRIICKANNREVGGILESIGADLVIYPEEEAGHKAARMEAMSGIIEYIEITKNVAGVETVIPEKLVGKTLRDMSFSMKYGITVVLIIRDGEPMVSQIGDVVFKSGDLIFIVGEKSKIELFKKKVG